MADKMPHKPKMASKSDAPPGLELDGHGNAIPFDERTDGDKQKVRDNIASALQGTQSVKNPNKEAEIPAQMRPGLAGVQQSKAHPSGPAGQQGGTKGTGRE
jgi:hypothetical protein